MLVNGCHYNPYFGKKNHHGHIPHGRDMSLICAVEPCGTCWDRLKVFITPDQNSYLLNTFHSSADESSLQNKEENNGHFGFLTGNNNHYCKYLDIICLF